MAHRITRSILEKQIENINYLSEPKRVKFGLTFDIVGATLVKIYPNGGIHRCSMTCSNREMNNVLYAVYTSLLQIDVAERDKRE